MEIIKVNCWAGNRKGDDFGTVAEKLSTMFLIKRHFIVLSLLVCFHFGQRGFLHFPECLSTPPPRGHVWTCSFQQFFRSRRRRRWQLRHTHQQGRDFWVKETFIVTPPHSEVHLHRVWVNFAPQSLNKMTSAMNPTPCDFLMSAQSLQFGFGGI